jgi:hypothetical protein
VDGSGAVTIGWISHKVQPLYEAGYVTLCVGSLVEGKCFVCMFEFPMNTGSTLKIIYSKRIMTKLPTSQTYDGEPLFQQQMQHSAFIVHQYGAQLRVTVVLQPASRLKQFGEKKR